MMNVEKYIMLVLMIIYLFSVYVNSRWQTPILMIVNRWINWIMISLIIGYLTHQIGLLDKPIFLLSGTVFLGWFLIETILIWIKIRILNFSNIPFFPRYTISKEEILWPVQDKYIELREFLRSHEFKEEQSIKASILGIISLYSPVYKDSLGKILLQLIFFPQKDGSVTVFYIIMSITTEGDLYITDNLSLPLGCYTPKNWVKKRKPLWSSLKRLLVHHEQSLKESKKNFVAWESTPLEIINNQQSILEFYNIKEGFLNPSNLHESFGKLTSEGRYCLWKQSLFLKYFGYCIP